VPLDSKFWLDVLQTLAIVAASVIAAWQINVAARQLRVAAEAYNLAAQQTRIAAEASSATTLGALAAASRDMQWKILEDVSLHRLFDEDCPIEGLSAEQKEALVRGMLISHYSFVFEFKKLDQIKGAMWTALRADMHGFFNVRASQERWEKLRALYSPDFREFVEKELLHLT